MSAAMVFLLGTQEHVRKRCGKRVIGVRPLKFYCILMLLLLLLLLNILLGNYGFRDKSADITSLSAVSQVRIRIGSNQQLAISHFLSLCLNPEVMGTLILSNHGQIRNR